MLWKECRYPGYSWAIQDRENDSIPELMSPGNRRHFFLFLASAI